MTRLVLASCIHELMCQPTRPRWILNVEITMNWPFRAFSNQTDRVQTMAWWIFQVLEPQTTSASAKSPDAKRLRECNVSFCGPQMERGSRGAPQEIGTVTPRLIVGARHGV